MSAVLNEICDRKRAHVADKKSSAPLADIQALAADQPPARGFLKALTTKQDNGRYGLIAEIKKASPSKGLIRPDDFDPATLAKAYEQGGAACLSVLTDIPYFQGHDSYLQQARAAVSLPALRKDFMVDPYQIYESRALGADCILIILAALDQPLADELEGIALDLGMDVLIEVHDREEMTRALGMKSPLVGVNNRNLKTMEVSLDNTLTLAPMAVAKRHLVAESGLATRADLDQAAAIGVNSFLIGETFMRQKDVSAAVKAILG